MSTDPCFLPPGREWHIRNCLPVIPVPLWTRWRATGRWPQGIQKGLDETATCHSQDAVVVDGQVIAVTIAGVFPPGWYKHCVAQPDEDPPTPEDTLEVIASIDILRESIRAPLTQGSPLAQGSPRCIPVPTIDVLAPWPQRPAPRMTIAGQLIDVQPGDFGRVCLRIPGTDHGLWGTGLGIVFTDPRFLSELGRAYVRQAQGQFAGLPGSWFYALWDGQGINDPTPRQWWTRDFAFSHMQPGCITGQLRYPDGTPARTRWRHGGDRPAQPIGAGWDVFEVQHHVTGAWISSWMGIRPYAAHLFSRIPEAPLGTSQFNGPPPGAFLPEGAYDAAAQMAPPLGPSALGRTSHDPPSRGKRSLYGAMGSTSHDPPSRGKRSLYGATAIGNPFVDAFVGYFGDYGPRTVRTRAERGGFHGFFDEVGDVFEKARDLVGDVLEKVRDLTAEVWEHLPSEVRKLAIQFGPLVTNMFVPGAGVAANMALQALEGGRKGELAKKALRRAQKEGQLPAPSVLDLDNPEHVLALSRITDPGLQRETGVAPGAAAGDPTAQVITGGGLLVAALAVL